MSIKLSTAVNNAIQTLVRAEHFHAGSIVSMPVLYPSGASVVLELFAQGDRVMVSDRGGGHMEAEYIAATRIYSGEANRIARDAGIKFDGRDMFIAEASLDRVDAAMAIVASCSSIAAAQTAIKVAERDERDAKQALFERLVEVFGENGFKRDVPFIGASNHKWNVEAVVEGSGSPIIFNSVTKSYVSATGTAAKFNDLGRLDLPPKRVAVITSAAAIGDWYGLISASSSLVIEMQAANDQFAHAREVA
jgi:hypothetical protein